MKLYYSLKENQELLKQQDDVVTSQMKLVL